MCGVGWAGAVSKIGDAASGVGSRAAGAHKGLSHPLLSTLVTRRNPAVVNFYLFIRS